MSNFEISYDDIQLLWIEIFPDARSYVHRNQSSDISEARFCLSLTGMNEGKRKGKKRKKEWKEWSNEPRTRGRHGVQQRQNRKERKLVPRVAIGGRHFCLLAVFPARFHGYCSHRFPVIIVLTFVCLFPSSATPSRGHPNSRAPCWFHGLVSANFSFNLAVEKSLDSPPLPPSFFFLVYFHQLHLFPFVSKSLSLSLSLVPIFFLPLSFHLSGFVFEALCSAVSFASLVSSRPTTPLNTANAFMNMHSRWPRPTGGCHVESDMLARNRFISWYLISRIRGGCSRLSLTFALKKLLPRRGFSKFLEDFGLGFEEFPIRDRCHVIDLRKEKDWG